MVSNYSFYVQHLDDIKASFNIDRGVCEDFFVNNYFGISPNGLFFLITKAANINYHKNVKTKEMSLDDLEKYNQNELYIYLKQNIVNYQATIAKL